MIYILASGGKMKKGILAVLMLSGHCLVSAQTITLVSPKGGETWGLGSPQIITWNYSGIPDGTPVKLVLFKDGSADLAALCASVRASVRNLALKTRATHQELHLNSPAANMSLHSIHSGDLQCELVNGILTHSPLGLFRLGSDRPLAVSRNEHSGVHREPPSSTGKFVTLNVWSGLRTIAETRPT